MLAQKLFLGLGVVTIISGVVLVFQYQALVGISGAIVGVWLVWDNWQKLKKADSNGN